jgi:membrane protein implicated in regulation of membrane protease activity
MEPWVVWILIAVVFAVGEIASLSLFLAPFAGGALVAALVSVIGLGAALSVAAFIAASAALLLALRPVAKRHLRTSVTTRTGAAALVGKEALVLERVAGESGKVKLDGETWTARAYDGDEVLEPGARVTVIEIKGATALVSE